MAHGQRLKKFLTLVEKTGIRMRLSEFQEFEGARASSPTPSIASVELMSGPPPPPQLQLHKPHIASANTPNVPNVARPDDSASDLYCMNSVCETLKVSISELEQEIKRLRVQAEQSSTTNWIMIAAALTVLVVCIAFCMQSSRQLAHATEVLAWSCGQRKQAAPYFQPIP